MPRKLFKPSIEELDLLKPGATQNGKVSEADWVAKCCNMSARILLKDPRRYRSYGPYWWVQKHAMIKNGIKDFGDNIDAEWCEIVDYGNDFYNLLAALMYSNSAMDAGLIYSNAHTVEFEPEEEGMERDVGEYTLADEDMELLALEKG